MGLQASKPILDNINCLGDVFKVGLGLNPGFLDFFNLPFKVLDLAKEAKEEACDALKGDFPKLNKGG
ncbi:hypothetical protein RHS03_08146, partial [Rhizoctonia solani]